MRVLKDQCLKACVRERDRQRQRRERSPDCHRVCSEFNILPTVSSAPFSRALALALLPGRALHDPNIIAREEVYDSFQGP